jgi:hypothetical protein
MYTHIVYIRTYTYIHTSLVAVLGERIQNELVTKVAELIPLGRVLHLGPVHPFSFPLFAGKTKARPYDYGTVLV